VVQKGEVVLNEDDCVRKKSLIVLRVARSSTNRYEGGSTNENRRPLQVDELKSVIDVTRKPHCIRLRREEGDTLKPELTVVL
jgi:hypothetical protein